MKKLTIRQERDMYRNLLIELANKKYHEPNSDHHEYCAGCGRSPYNIPSHDLGCIVPRIGTALKTNK